MLMAAAVDRAAAETPGKEARAMEAFARALRQLPAIIAENGGYDSAQLCSELRAAHAQGKNTMGLGKINVNFFLLANHASIVALLSISSKIMLSLYRWNSLCESRMGIITLTDSVRKKLYWNGQPPFAIA